VFSHPNGVRPVIVVDQGRGYAGYYEENPSQYSIIQMSGTLQVMLRGAETGRMNKFVSELISNGCLTD
jgi:hypothetical protein